VAEILDSREEAQFLESVAYSSRFLMGESHVQQALLRICDALSAAGERVSLVPLNVLIELKLASGISAPHRLRDLADVLELIRIRKLGDDFADALDPSVRAKYLELCAAAKHAMDER
jgi:hypothetical protein